VKNPSNLTTLQPLNIISEENKMLIQLTPQHYPALREWFLPEQPGLALVGLHILNTGNGACFVDRWPEPRIILANTAGNYILAGDPTALDPADLQKQVAGFVQASIQFEPLFRAAFPTITVWDRVIAELTDKPRVSRTGAALVRRLQAGDIYLLWGLNLEMAWIWKTWGGPAALAAAEYAWGAFIDSRLVSIACTFFVGDQYEELGVVTDPAFRGLGLSAACAGALCEDIRARGRRPSWSTSPDNIASLRVAEKLGFTITGHSFLYVAGIAVPIPAQRQTAEETI
jgi:RimJ/RimL family protein N-acetyltransferase